MNAGASARAILAPRTDRHLLTPSGLEPLLAHLRALDAVLERHDRLDSEDADRGNAQRNGVFDRKQWRA